MCSLAGTVGLGPRREGQDASRKMYHEDSAAQNHTSFAFPGSNHDSRVAAWPTLHIVHKSKRLFGKFSRRQPNTG